ncbi:MAG TPA: Ku protein [Pyrinomonadaceae bacterium]|nr:Ku protein [Pyrinomonadaceae bacterium]
MALRSVWKGNITFLLVSVAIKVYTAVESAQKISFNQLHGETCRGPVGHQQQCKKCNQVVDKEEIVKGYKHGDDQFVIISQEEIDAIKPESSKTIEILGFVDRSEIPNTFFDSPYLAVADGPASGKPYALLKAVMQQTGRVAIGKVILREREDLVSISATDEGLIIQTLRYPREVRTFAALPQAKEESLSDEELELATALVERMQTTFTEIEPTDHYYEALRAMLDRKIAGKVIEKIEKPATSGKVVDIMEALRASLTVKNAPPVAVDAGEPINNQPAVAVPTQPQLTLVAPIQTESKKTRRRNAA